MARTWDVWVSEWSVVLRYPDGSPHEHTFKLAARISHIMGIDRAERDAREFRETFEQFAEVLYCGPSADCPKSFDLDAEVRTLLALYDLEELTLTA